MIKFTSWHPLPLLCLPQGDANTECADYSGNTALHCAAAQGNVAIVSLLLAAGVCVCVCVCVCEREREREIEGEWGYFSSIIHIHVGADVTVQNQEGETPLAMAELGNHLDVAKILQDAMHTGMEKPDGETMQTNICDSVHLLFVSSLTQSIHYLVFFFHCYRPAHYKAALCHT